MEKMEFNPQKNYSWAPTDKLVLTGMELNIIHNALSAVFGTVSTEAQKYVMLHEAFKASTEIVKRGVSEGVIKEMPQELTNEKTQDSVQSF